MEYKNDPRIEELNTNSPYQTFNNDFWIMLLLFIFIFGMGFLAGNIMHDTCCHAIEQLQK